MADAAAGRAREEAASEAIKVLRSNGVLSGALSRARCGVVEIRVEAECRDPIDSGSYDLSREKAGRVVTAGYGRMKRRREGGIRSGRLRSYAGCYTRKEEKSGRSGVNGRSYCAEGW